MKFKDGLLLGSCNLQKYVMKMEHSKNFEKKASLNIRKIFQYNDGHNIFELTCGTTKAENHLSYMELLINEDMYDIATQYGL